MRKGLPGTLTCPNCGAAVSISVDDGFETKALAPAALETKTLELAFTVKSVDRKQRIIEGYASTPDLDSGFDIVEPNACKFNDPTDVGVYIGHDWRLGALPTGVPLEIRQDAKGLFTKTRIYETARGDELLTVAEERLAIGKPLGQSIGYPTDSVKARFERKDGRVIRHIDELLLQEFSYTPIPMNEKAVTTGVKARAGMKAADMSLSERQKEVREAIRERQQPGFMWDPEEWVYVVDTYDDYVIVSDGDDYFQIAYSIGEDGEALLGDTVEVDRVWVRKGAAGDAEVGDEAKARSWSAVNKSTLPKSAFAYAPGKKRSDWKLPHHNPDGSVNPAGVKAALAAIAGARTGKPMDVPASAKAHLEAHEKALQDEKAARLALATKAGRVLSEASIERVQTIHDAAHELADSTGFDLHADDDAEDPEESSNEGSDDHGDEEVKAGELLLEHAFADAQLGGGK